MTFWEGFRFIPTVARGWTLRVRGSLFPSEETTYPIQVMATKKGQTKGGSSGTSKSSAPLKPASKKAPTPPSAAAPKKRVTEKTTEPKEPKGAKGAAKLVKVAVPVAAPVPVPAVKAPAKKTAPKSKPKVSEPLVAPQFTPEVIAVRAYFLAEKRRAQGGAPDPTHDWLQAESELLAEIERFNAKGSGKSTSKKKS